MSLNPFSWTGKWYRMSLRWAAIACAIAGEFRHDIQLVAAAVLLLSLAVQDFDYGAKKP